MTTDMTRKVALDYMQYYLRDLSEDEPNPKITDWLMLRATQWAQVAEALRPEPTTYVGGGPG